MDNDPQSLRKVLKVLSANSLPAATANGALHSIIHFFGLLVFAVYFVWVRGIGRLTRALFVSILETSNSEIIGKNAQRGSQRIYRHCTSGYRIDDVLPLNVAVEVRKTANLHTGGTIHDVTQQISPKVREAAIVAADAMGLGVVGLDFIMPKITGDEYYIIEANERPGLANHEPQPVVESFINYLFPGSERGHVQ